MNELCVPLYVIIKWAKEEHDVIIKETKDEDDVIIKEIKAAVTVVWATIVPINQKETKIVIKAPKFAYARFGLFIISVLFLFPLAPLL